MLPDDISNLSDNQQVIQKQDDRELGVIVAGYLATKRSLETAERNEEQSRKDVIDATKAAERKFPIALRLDGKLVVVNKPFYTMDDLDVYYPEELA